MAVSSLSKLERFRYLLGLSSPAEREFIESKYFEDEGAFQEMLTAEDDLIDAYARGELSGDERQSFEKNFATSLREQKRIHFARAFAKTVSATKPAETKLPGNVLVIFKTLRSPGLSRITTIAAMIAFVAVLAWLVFDRKQINNEVRTLRPDSAELSKRIEELSGNPKPYARPTAAIANQLTDSRVEPDNPKHFGQVTTAIANQQTDSRVQPDMPKHFGQVTTATLRRPFPKASPDREEPASSKPDRAEKLINAEDAPLGNTFTAKKITQLPVDVNSVPGLLTLQPQTTPSESVTAGRTDQSNLTPAGVDPLNIYSLLPQNGSNAETIIQIPNSLGSIRFQIALEMAAVHEEYRVTIKTADGRSITSVNWARPLAPNTTIIDTPAISTSDLSSGDYVLLLLGKNPEGEFIQVARYALKVIRY